MSQKLNPHTINDLAARVKASGLRAVARATGVSPNTIKNALAGRPITPQTDAALKKLPPTVRQKEEFDTGPRYVPNRTSGPVTSWTVESIRTAVDAQMSGRFSQPKRLAEAMRRDDAIFTARSNRTAPVSSIATALEPHDSGTGRRIAADAQDSVQVSRTVLRSIVGTLVDHSIAIGYNEHEPNARGTRVDMRLTEWPLEHVWYDEHRESLVTLTRDHEIVPIRHGDGRWTIFRRTAVLPWREDACVLPAGFVWAAHAEGVAHWQSSSKSHGLAKIVGAMGEGHALNDADGAVPVVVQKFIDMISDLADGTSQVVLKPFGAEVDFLSNNSTAWQVFSENILSREKAAARIFLGTDAIMGAAGGAPGIDISQLFGVATTRLQGDFTALSEGLASGVYAPWTALNYGDSRNAPRMAFLLPDPDTIRTREEEAANRERLVASIERMRAVGLLVTQDEVDRLARLFGVHPPPRLAS